MSIISCDINKESKSTVHKICDFLKSIEFPVNSFENDLGLVNGCRDKLIAAII
jgi:hypothetical protein